MFSKRHEISLSVFIYSSSFLLLLLLLLLLLEEEEEEEEEEKGQEEKEEDAPLSFGICVGLTQDCFGID